MTTEASRELSPQPVAYRYKFIDWIGREVWSHELPWDRKPLETVALFSAEQLEAASAGRSELLKALKELLDVWDAICNVKGWDRDHLFAAENARSLIAKHTKEKGNG